MDCGFCSCADSESEVCRYKSTPRSEESLKNLDARLNRIIGQLGGIKKMLADNRYCGDILTQLSAAESALQSLGYIILKEHMESCVREQILSGSKTVVDETVELIKKMK